MIKAGFAMQGQPGISMINNIQVSGTTSTIKYTVLYTQRVSTESTAPRLPLGVIVRGTGKATDTLKRAYRPASELLLLEGLSK